MATKLQIFTGLTMASTPASSLQASSSSSTSLSMVRRPLTTSFFNGGGEGNSRSVLAAFFLGKALAEALNEQLESSVGEFFSTIGRLQAEQQKQVEDFQVNRASDRYQEQKDAFWSF